MGNLVGSNIFNTLLVTGAAGVIKPFKLSELRLAGGFDYWIVVIVSVAFALAVRTQVDVSRYALIGLSVEDAGSYPAITGEFSHVFHASDPLAEAGLRPGHRLVRLGGAAPLGAGTRGLVAGIFG